MNEALAALYDELLRRQRLGEREVYLSDDALDFLKASAASAQASTLEPEERPRASAEPPIEGTHAPKAPQRKVVKPEVPTPPEAPVVTPGEGSREERWKTVSQQILEDPWCLSQVKPGKKLVPGTGSLEADIFFCGEAPGAEEEVQGEPFVGPAGQLLTRIIRAMGLSREDVFIGNIMTYRPPMPSPVGNRPPSVDELTYCLPYLKAQLALVQPKVIVGLGKTALDGLLGPDTKRRMTRIRGQWQAFEGIPLMPTFHPSYLLRNQSLATKRQVWEDMLAVMERIGLPISEKQRGFFLKDQD